MNSTWKDGVLQFAENVLVIPSTRVSPAINSDVHRDDSNVTEGDELPNKRPKIEESTPQQSIMSYWPDSPEARQVFRPRTTRRRMRTAVGSDEDGNTAMLCGESAKLAVERRIKLLQTVREKEDSWQNIAMGRDKENFAQRSRFLRSGSVP